MYVNHKHGLLAERSSQAAGPAAFLCPGMMVRLEQQSVCWARAEWKQIWSRIQKIIRLVTCRKMNLHQYCTHGGHNNRKLLSKKPQ